jgi:hypothetical protein
MALFLRPFRDTDLEDNLTPIRRRKQPDLPEHILGHVEWIATTDPGYYIYIPEDETFEPVEFIDNSWWTIYKEGDFYFTTKEDQIPRYSKGTGYWKVTDPQHPEHVPEELPPIPGPSLLFVPRQHTDSLESEELSLFVATANPEYPEEEHYTIPLTEVGSSILAAQFQHVLSLEERESENPLTPQEPAYLQLIEQAVDTGLHIPTPPPALTPEELHTSSRAHTPIAQIQPVLPPIAIVVPLVQQPPAQMANRFNGNPPSIFNGSRKQSATFL